MPRSTTKVLSIQQNPLAKASYCLVQFAGEFFHVAAQFERALCGLDVTGGSRCEIPADFGKDVDDCDECVAAWARIEKARSR